MKQESAIINLEFSSGATEILTRMAQAGSWYNTSRILQSARRCKNTLPELIAGPARDIAGRDAARGELRC